MKTKSFRAGMTVEIVSSNSLKQACELMTDSSDKEHLTSYYYDHLDKFKVHNLTWYKSNDSKLSFVVDTETDIEKAKWLVSQLGDEVFIAPIKRLIELVRYWEVNNNVP